MDCDWRIESRKGEHAYIHIRQADLGFWKFERDSCHRMAQVAFWVEVAWVLVAPVCVGLEEVRPCLCASRVSVDSLRCHFGKEGGRRFGFHKPSPGVIILQLSPFYAQQIQHPTSSLPGLLRKVSWTGDVLPLSRRAKTLFWPFLPYSRRGACLTVLAVPDLVALP